MSVDRDQCQCDARILTPDIPKPPQGVAARSASHSGYLRIAQADVYARTAGPVQSGLHLVLALRHIKLAFLAPAAWQRWYVQPNGGTNRLDTFRQADGCSLSPRESGPK